MHDFLEEVAREELAPGELRELLERLAVSQLAEELVPSLGDVSEATGIEVATLARILADLRGANFDEWKDTIESRLDHHAHRLRRLERVAEPELDSTPDPEHESSDESTIAGLLPAVPGWENEPSAAPNLGISLLLLFALFGILVFLGAMCGTPGRY